MRFRVFPDRDALARETAALVWESAKARPDLLICLASGETPTPTYGLLAGRPARLADARFIQLDEWEGLGTDHPASCAAYLRRTLIGPLAVPDRRWIAFRGDARDAEAECRRVREALAETGPIDLCILGLGRNGHLALNEPADGFDPFCHVAALDSTTRGHAMLSESAETVHRGLTLGLGEILRARRILLLVSGAAKRAPLARLAARRVTPGLPASFLWLHGDATCLCDRDAATGSGLGDGGREDGR